MDPEQYPLHPVLDYHSPQHITLNITHTLQENLVYWSIWNKTIFETIGLPSRLETATLPSGTNTARLVDFRGLNLIEAITKVLRFYEHKGYRRRMGDNVVFHGFVWVDGMYCAVLSP